LFKITTVKKIILLSILNLSFALFFYGQGNNPDEHQQKAFSSLIDRYSVAREKSDTTLLKSILTEDIDQLVSTGEWRKGIGAAVQGMLKSSATSPGTRTLRIESMRMLSSTSAIVDCRYEIKNTGGTTRNMWSSFLVVAKGEIWKISAIRNMLPASQ
jgi:hypothetical protein